MRRNILVISAVSCLLLPIASQAQPSGGTGNHQGGVAGAGAPTIEDDIDMVRQAVEKARDDKTISEHKADSTERKLKSIEHKLAHLSREVLLIRQSLR